MANILIISHEYPPFIGGAGSVAETWVKVLSNQHKITLVTRYHPQRDRLDLNFNLYEVKTKPVIFAFFYWRVLRVLLEKNDNFDAIILNDLGATQVAAFFFNKFQKAKCWLYFHGNELEVLFKEKNIKSIFYLPFFKNLLRKVNKLIFASKFLRDKILCEIDKNNSLINNSFVVYPSIDNTKFYWVASDCKEKLHIAENKIVILTVARIVEKKGLLKIARIMADLKKEEKKYHWILVGTGPFEKELQSKVLNLGLGGSFTILNKIKRNELKYFYSMADMFVLLSDFEESFGLVYLEANACGTVVIGNNKGGVSEVIQSGTSGYLVNNVEDALKAIKGIKNKVWDAEQLINYSNMFNESRLTDQINCLLKSV